MEALTCLSQELPVKMDRPSRQGQLPVDMLKENFARTQRDLRVAFQKLQIDQKSLNLDRKQYATLVSGAPPMDGALLRLARDTLDQLPERLQMDGTNRALLQNAIALVADLVSFNRQIAQLEGLPEDEEMEESSPAVIVMQSPRQYREETSSGVTLYFDPPLNANTPVRKRAEAALTQAIHDLRATVNEYRLATGGGKNDVTRQLEFVTKTWEPSSLFEAAKFGKVLVTIANLITAMGARGMTPETGKELASLAELQRAVMATISAYHVVAQAFGGLDTAEQCSLKSDKKGKCCGGICAEIHQ